MDGKTRRGHSPDRSSLKKEPGPDIRIPDSRLKKNRKTRSELLKKPVRNPRRTGFYTDVSGSKICRTGTYPVRLTSGTGVSQKKEPGSGAEKGSESGAHKTGSTPIFGLQRLF